MAFKKISGEALCGFADMFEGSPLLGAAGVAAAKNPAKAGTPAKGSLPPAALKSPAKPWKRTPLDKAKAIKMHPIHSVAPLLNSAAHVNAVLNRAISSLKKPAANASKKMVMLGAAITKAASTGKPLTPKQQAKVAKAKASATKADNAAKKLQAVAIKALPLGKAARSLALSIKSTHHSVHGVYGDYIGDSTPDPNNPGLLMDGTLDPNYQDPTTGAASDVPLTPALPIEMLCSMPVPADGIKYNGENGWPAYAIGSASYYYGPNRNNTDRPKDGSESGMYGWIWGWNHANMNNLSPPRWVIRFGQAGDPQDAGSWLLAVTSGGLTVGAGRYGNDNWHDQQGVGPDQPEQLQVPGDAQAALSDPVIGQFKYPDGQTVTAPGPFIGNPNGALKNLRFSTADSQWFWFLEEAPDAFTAPLKYAAAKAAQAAAAADAAAQATAAAQAASDAAAAQAAQDAQDAANALAESASASQVQQAQDAADAANLQLQAAQAAAQAQAAQAQPPQAPYAPQQDDGPDDDPDDGSDPEADSQAEADAMVGSFPARDDEFGGEEVLYNGENAVLGADGRPINLDQWGILED